MRGVAIVLINKHFGDVLLKWQMLILHVVLVRFFNVDFNLIPVLAF